MQRNVSDFGIFNLVEILKNFSQKGFEKKERMQKHLQQSSSMEESVRVSLKAGAKGLSSRKYKMK